MGVSLSTLTEVDLLAPDLVGGVVLLVVALHLEPGRLVRTHVTHVAVDGLPGGRGGETWTPLVATLCGSKHSTHETFAVPSSGMVKFDNLCNSCF